MIAAITTGVDRCADDALTGNAAANVLTGGAGDDVLEGGAGAEPAGLRNTPDRPGQTRFDRIYNTSCISR